MRLYDNRNTGAITRDRATGATLSASDPVLAKRGDSPALQLQFHRDGPPERPAAPLITFIVKTLGDYNGPAIIETTVFTTPSTDEGFYTLYPDLTSDTLKEALFVGTVTNRVADATARKALTGLAVGNVVQQTGTTPTTYWQVVNASSLSSDAGWTSDVSFKDSVDFGAEIVLQESPGFGEETSQSIVFRVQADYEHGGETAPTPGTPFAAGITLNLSSVTALTGGTAGKLDYLPTAGGVIAPLTLATLDLDAGGPYTWRLRTSPVVSTSSVANPSVITTATPHRFVTGQTVTIGGHTGSTPDINGDHVVTVLSPATFSIPTNVTVAGSGGYASPTTDTGTYGVVRPVDFDAVTNPVTWRSVA